MADGSIIIDTLLRIDGYMKNMKKIHASQEKLKGQIQETISKMDRLQKEIDDLNNSEVSNAKIDKLKEQIAVCNKESESLKDQMSKLAEIQVPTKEFNELQQFIGVTESRLNKLLDREGKMSEIGKKGTSGWKSLQYDIEETRASLAYAKSEMNELKLSGGAYTSGVNSSQYEKIGAQLTQITQKQQKYNVALESTKAKEIQSRDKTIEKKRIEQEKLNRILETQNAKYEEAKTKINAVNNSFSKLGNVAKQGIGTRVAKATESCNRGISKLSHSIGSFAKRLLNVGLSVFVFTVLNRAMTALKERIGLLIKKNQQLSTSLSQIKGNLKTAFQTVYEAALPALNALMNVLVKVTAKIANFTAAIFGKSVKASQAAAEAADNQAESVGSVGEAAKKASEYLNSYDEMNVQSSQDSSGGGGGGPSTGTAYEDIDADGEVSDFVKRIKEAWEKGDFTGLGKIIGGKLIAEMESIPWEDIYKKAENFGKGLANFLNGLFSEDESGNTVFGEVGKTIAGALNTTLKFLDSFGTTFEWKNFGNSIASGINNFFKTFEFDTAAAGIKTWMKGSLDAVTTLFAKTDFELIGNKIGEFLADLDLTNYLDDIAGLIWEAIKGSFGLLKGLFEEAPLETSLIAAFGVLKFTGLGSSLAGQISTALSSYFAMNGIALPSLSSVAMKLGVAITVAIIGYKIGERLYEKLTGEEAVGGLSDLIDMGATWEEIGQAISDGAIVDITLTPLLKWISGDNSITTDEVIDAMTDMLEDAVNGVKDFTVSIKGKIEESFTSAKESFESIKDSEAVKKLSALGKDVLDGAKNTWESIKTEGVTKTLKQVGKNVIDAAKNSWIAMKTEEVVKTLKAKGKENIDKAKKTWTSIKSGTKTLALKAKDNASKIVNAFKSKWDKLKDKTLSIKGNIQANIDNIKSLINTRIISKINSGLIGTINKHLPGKVKVPNIPLLANGAVIPPNAPFLAMLGDQKNGTNIETPLSTMIEAFTAALDSRNDSGNIPVVNVYVGGQKITDYVIKDVKNRTIASGGMNPLLV